MVVLTDPKDEAWILSKKGREAMVDALAKGTVAAVRALD
jgi:N-acetylmuramoyl-L-alanine amidase